MLLNCGVGEYSWVPWTARRSNQSILKEIGPGSSLEGLMLKLKLQYFGHLMWRSDSLEMTLMLGKIEGGRRRGRQSKLRELVMDREAWRAAVHAVAKSQTDWIDWYSWLTMLYFACFSIVPMGSINFCPASLFTFWKCLVIFFHIFLLLYFFSISGSCLQSVWHFIVLFFHFVLNAFLTRYFSSITLSLTILYLPPPMRSTISCFQLVLLYCLIFVSCFQYSLIFFQLVIIFALSSCFVCSLFYLFWFVPCIAFMVLCSSNISITPVSVDSF